MGAAENKEVVRRMGEAQGPRRDARHHGRRHPLDHHRFDQVVAFDERQEGNRRQAPPSDFCRARDMGSSAIDNVIAEGDFVVQSHASGRKTKTGNPYNNTYCNVYKVVGGKIKERSPSTSIPNW